MSILPLGYGITFYRADLRLIKNALCIIKKTKINVLFIKYPIKSAVSFLFW